MEKIYAIYDLTARAIVGQLAMFRHDAAAMRFFSDVASQRETIVGMHPQEFELIALGMIDENQNVIPNREKILTGEQWLAMQERGGTAGNT